MVIKNKILHVHNIMSNTCGIKLCTFLNFILPSKVNHIRYSLAQHSAIFPSKTTVFKFTRTLSWPLNLNLYKVTTSLKFNSVFYMFATYKYGFIYSMLLTYRTKLKKSV